MEEAPNVKGVFEREKKMSGYFKTINGVQCWVCPFVSRLTHKKHRLVAPVKIDGIVLPLFLLGSHARKASRPVYEYPYVLVLSLLYWVYCHRYLLHRRKFDLMSLSSPYYPIFEKLAKESGLEPTGCHPLDNLLKLVTWGDSSESLEDPFHKALYRRPRLLPVSHSNHNLNELEYETFKRLAQEMEKKILETRAPMEEQWREIIPSVMAAFLYITEKKLFSIYAKEMPEVYGRIQKELTPPEQALFEFCFFPNPRYFERIIGLDPSPVFQGYFDMRATLNKWVPPWVLESFDPPTWNRIWTAYLAFYPAWIPYVRDEEKKREEKQRKTGRSISYEARSGEAFSDIEPGEIADHSVNPQFQALINAGYKPDNSFKVPPVAKRSKRKKPSSDETYFSDIERQIIVLGDAEITQKNMAEKLGCAPSTITKKLKKIRKDLDLSLESVMEDMLRKLWRKLRDGQREILKNKETTLHEIYQTGVKEAVEIMGKSKKFDLKELEEYCRSAWYNK